MENGPSRQKSAVESAASSASRVWAWTRHGLANSEQAGHVNPSSIAGGANAAKKFRTLSCMAGHKPEEIARESFDQVSQS